MDDIFKHLNWQVIKFGIGVNKVCIMLLMIIGFIEEIMSTQNISTY